MFFKLIKVHLLVSELYIYQDAYYNDNNFLCFFISVPVWLNVGNCASYVGGSLFRVWSNHWFNSHICYGFHQFLQTCWDNTLNKSWPPSSTSLPFHHSSSLSPCHGKVSLTLQKLTLTWVIFNGSIHTMWLMLMQVKCILFKSLDCGVHHYCYTIAAPPAIHCYPLMQTAAQINHCYIQLPILPRQDKNRQR